MIDQVMPSRREIRISPQINPIVKSPFEILKLRFRIFALLFRVLFKQNVSLRSLMKFIPKVNSRYQKAFGEPFLSKVAFVDGRYFWRFGTPGFPSLAASEMAENEIQRTFSESKRNGKFPLLVFFSITKQCPLNCEHCLDWHNHNRVNTLSKEEIVKIVRKFQDSGSTQFVFSGGEPLLRVNAIYEVLKSARPSSEFWINTSGLGLTKERATKLKELGLTGVMISLDHFDAIKHDAFRGFEGAYENAITGIINTNAAGLVSGLTICPTREFISRENLQKFMGLAKKLGVAFVQFSEPRAAGRYSGKDVELRKREIDLLEEAYINFNSDQELKEFPIINYVGYQQRRLGCAGAANRFFYIDADGDAHVCPFCSNKVANTLEFSAQDVIRLLHQYPCHNFEKAGALSRSEMAHA